MFRRYAFAHPGASVQPSSASGGNAVFEPEQLQAVVDGMVPHPWILDFTVSGSIVQASGGSNAILASDWIRLIGKPTFESNNEQLISNCRGLAIQRIIQAQSNYASMGAAQFAIGPDVAVSSGGATTPIKFHFIISFWPNRYNPYTCYLRPLKFWTGGTWTIPILDPHTEFGTAFTWSAAPTVTLNVIELVGPQIIWAQPFEWREVFVSSTSSATADIRKGIYQVLGYSAPAFGGFAAGDDLVAKLSALYAEKLPYRFPQSFGSGLNLANLAHVIGADTHTSLVVGSGKATSVSPFYASVASATMTPQAAAVLLAGPNFDGMQENPYDNQLELDEKTTFSADLVGGQSLTEGHLYWMARAKFISDCDKGALAGPVGETTRELISNQKGLSGCSGGFRPFVPYVPPGVHTPNPVMLTRLPLISKAQ